jgi:hypothetical protein
MKGDTFMSSFCRSVGAVATLWLMLPPVGAPPAYAEPRRTAEIKTALHGLASGETLVVRGVETLPGAPPIHMEVEFWTDGGTLVKRSAGDLSASRPLSFLVSRQELTSASPLAAVRAVIRISSEAGFSQNQAFLNYEFYTLASPSDRCGGGCSVCSHDSGFACAPTSQGGVDVMCEGGATVTKITDGE